MGCTTSSSSILKKLKKKKYKSSNLSLNNDSIKKIIDQHERIHKQEPYHYQQPENSKNEDEKINNHPKELMKKLSNIKDKEKKQSQASTQKNKRNKPMSGPVIGQKGIRRDGYFLYTLEEMDEDSHNFSSQNGEKKSQRYSMSGRRMSNFGRNTSTIRKEEITFHFSPISSRVQSQQEFISMPNSLEASFVSKKSHNIRFEQLEEGAKNLPKIFKL